MNSLILLHNKYHLNSPKNNDNKEDSIDLEENINKNDNINNNTFIDDNKEEENSKINNSFQTNNIPNNIFDLSYMKNKNHYNYMSDKKYIGKLFHSYKKATKRSHLEAFPNIKNYKNINDINNIVNLNINNNNYFYINNNVYNVNSEEKYETNFSKSKRLKEN